MDNYDFIVLEAEKLVANYNDKKEKIENVTAKFKTIARQYEKKLLEEKTKLDALKNAYNKKEI